MTTHGSNPTAAKLTGLVFRGDQNAILVHSITGPHVGGMVILIRDPFELYEPAELYLQEQLSPNEVAAVTALAC